MGFSQMTALSRSAAVSHVFKVEGVGRPDVDGVELVARRPVVELVVADTVGYVVLVGEPFGLLRRTADEGRHLAEVGRFDGREGDVDRPPAQAEQGVPDRAVGRRLPRALLVAVDPVEH